MLVFENSVELFVVIFFSCMVSLRLAGNAKSDGVLNRACSSWSLQFDTLITIKVDVPQSRAGAELFFVQGYFAGAFQAERSGQR
jgi:hypothetical protein